jgi:hypothetical protein
MNILNTIMGVTCLLGALIYFGYIFAPEKAPKVLRHFSMLLAGVFVLDAGLTLLGLQ